MFHSVTSCRFLDYLYCHPLHAFKTAVYCSIQLDPLVDGCYNVRTLFKSHFHDSIQKKEAQ